MSFIERIFGKKSCLQRLAETETMVKEALNRNYISSAGLRHELFKRRQNAAIINIKERNMK